MGLKPRRLLFRVQMAILALSEESWARHKIRDAGCRVQGAGCMVHGVRYRVWVVDGRVQGVGYRV